MASVEPIVLANPTTSLAEYEAGGGYQALVKARAMTPADVSWPVSKWAATTISTAIARSPSSAGRCPSLQRCPTCMA